MFMESCEHKKCPECGKPLWGRADKKFCNDHCKSLFNNRTSILRLDRVKQINTILRRNRNILQNQLREQLIQVNLEELHIKGFDPRFYTHCVTHRNGKHIYYCYDVGYIRQGTILALITS